MNKTYTAGEQVIWQTMFRQWFSGQIVKDNGATVIVNRTSPSLSFGCTLEKFVNEYGMPDLRPTTGR